MNAHAAAIELLATIRENRKVLEAELDRLNEAGEGRAPRAELLRDRLRALISRQRELQATVAGRAAA